MEHTATRLVLDVLRTLCSHEALPPSSPYELEKCVQYLIINYARSHCAKEENELFPTLEALGGATRDALGGATRDAALTVLMPQHAAATEMIRRMIWALDRWESDPVGCCFDLQKQVEPLSELLDRHFSLEETVLYAYADSEMPEERVRTMVERFALIEHSRVVPSGPTPVEECAVWLERARSRHASSAGATSPQAGTGGT